MSSGRKYIPPHLRKSSANRPLASNDSYPNQNRHHNNINRDRYGQSSRQYRSNRRVNHRNYQNNSNDRFQSRHNSNSYGSGQRHSNQNNGNNNRFINRNKARALDETEPILEEKKEPNISQHCEMNTINLDKYIAQKQISKQITIEILLQYTDINTAKLIYDICTDDNILIPDTFARTEFFKYWFIVDKGCEIADFPFTYLHKVQLHPTYLQLIQKGAIASIQGYKPSKTAKLKLECKFMYNHQKDGLTFSFRSDGMRHSNTTAHKEYWVCFLSTKRLF